MHDIISLDKPSLQGLSYILRHKELWPEGFVWDFSFPQSCALGLAQKIWPTPQELRPQITFPCMDAETMFCLTSTEANDIFFESIRGIFYRDITPTQVADRIDNFLKDRIHD
jgi:hypothetical protein